MRAAVLHAPGDVRVEDRPDPSIEAPTDAVIRLAATCVCGSDLWPYRGIEVVSGPAPMGHEYVGIIEEVGSDVATIKPGQFVVGSFFASDNTCEICRAGYQSRCVHAELMGAIGTQTEYARIPLADGTLVATAELPSDDLVPSLLAASDVLSTGWFAAERIIAMSRHESRQQLATEFGATDIVEERGDAGVAAIKELTGGLGAHSVVEAGGAPGAVNQALHATPPRGPLRLVGGGPDVSLDGMGPFLSPAPRPRRPPPRRPRRLRGRGPRRLARRHGPVLEPGPRPRRPGAGAPLPARAHRPHLGPSDRAGQGVRPRAAARGGRRRLPRDGPARGDQGAAAAMSRFAGKVAFITGATSGIGRATALAFAHDGAAVVAADIADDGNRETARLIERAGGRALPVTCDVTRADDIEAALHAAIERFGRVDIAFNNAGSGQPVKPAHKIGDDEWDRLVAVNLRGAFIAMKLEIELMLRHGGAIVNTASGAGVRGFAGQ